MSRSWITILSLLLISQLASAKILLIGNNTFLSFDYVQATFTRIVESSGECGSLYAAEPLDACSDLTNTAEKGSKHRFAYVLIIRGGCSFEEKVRNAQKAGFKAAIVYNDGYDELLVPKFHAACIDSWLRLWRSFCPVCKRDAKAGNSDPPTSERTSLLSPSLSSSTSVQSLAIAIRQEPLLRSTVLQPYTVPTCHTQDLRNVFPKINIQNKPGRASPCWIRSSSMREDLLHQSDPDGSFSLFASSNSLPC